MIFLCFVLFCFILASLDLELFLYLVCLIALVRLIFQESTLEPCCLALLSYHVLLNSLRVNGSLCAKSNDPSILQVKQIARQYATIIE